MQKSNLRIRKKKSRSRIPGPPFARTTHLLYKGMVVCVCLWVKKKF